jgi:hypothetical protein
MEEHVTSLFVGVVSHERSRFAVSQGPEGLAEQLAAGLRGLDVSVDLQINIADLWDAVRHPVDDVTVRQTLRAQSQLEKDWDTYLDPPMSLTARVRSRASRYLRDLESAIRSTKVPMVKRLINIELSHLDLFDAGLASGAKWVLVLEDDAMTPNVTDCVAGIAGLTRTTTTPGFVNLSQSFSLEELGIAHLLQPAGATWQGSIERQILTAQRPVTNTVCAVMYHSEFLRRMVQAMRQLPFYPVVPIDWRINQALMAMVEAGTAGVNTAWFVEPGPIDQMSMR